MRVFLLSVFLGLTLFFAFPVDSYAAGIVPCDGPDCQTCHFIQLGTNILNWLIGVMASVCAVIIAVAGLKMATAGGNTGAVSSAKEMITNTIIGFIILLAAWLIVDTVMRTFVGDEVPGFGPWNRIECVTQPTVTPPPVTDQCTTASDPEACRCEAGGGVWNIGTRTCEGGVVSACPVPALSPITDPLALQMEGGQTVIWNNPTLQACVSRFTSRVGGTVTSAYRPPAYQTHLYEIRDRWCVAQGGGLRTNTTAACSALRATVSSEVTRHFGSNWQCGSVGQTSTHSSGIGVDITGINHSSASVRQAASDSCLIWRNYPNDAVHYDLVPGCTCN